MWSKERSTFDPENYSSTECCGRPYKRSLGREEPFFSSLPAENGLLAEFTWSRTGLGMGTKEIFSTLLGW